MPDHVLTYSARHFLLLTVPMPGDCETRVDNDGPFLAGAIRIELAILTDLLMKLDIGAYLPKMDRS